MVMAKVKAKVKPKGKPKRKARPKTKPYDRKKALDAIVERMVEGESLRQICGSDGVPNKSTVLRWLIDDDDLATIMARAREMLADALDDDINEVVQEVRSGALEPQAAQVIIRANQWRAGKMKPKVYGEKQVVDVNHGIQGMDDSELSARARQLADRLGITLPAGLLKPAKHQGDGG